MTASEVDPEAVAVAARIQWSAREDSRFPECFDADLAITCADGTRLQHAVPQVLGSPQRPAGKDAIRAKFLGNASLALPQESTARIWDLLTRGDGTLPALQQVLRAL
jgi:hypothetical protein